MIISLRFIRSNQRIFITLFLIGVLAVIFALYLFFTVRVTVPTPVVTDQPLVAGTPEFVATFAGITNSPISRGGTITLLDNGEEFVPDLVREINAASSSIYFSTYIWEEGEFSEQVVTALENAARRGVPVRILLDGYASRMPKDERRVLEESGAMVGIFRPLLSDPLAINSRTHRRAIGIDGRIAYTGGIAVKDTWLGGGKREDEWRDSMVKLTGPLAARTLDVFADEWLVATGEMLVGVPIAPSSATPVFVTLVTSAGDLNRPIANAFLVTAMGAQRSLDIANPYVLPDEALRSVLVEKARSGVVVRLLVPGPETDAKTVRYASQYYYQELLDAGVHIYEYQPSLMHRKAIVVDGTWSVIGSANIDNRSASLNDENLLGIEDRTFASALTASFDHDLLNAAKITPDAWNAIGSFHRAWLWVMAIPFKQY